MTTLIPRATPIEAAIEASAAARFVLPAQLVTTSWNPWTCPADQLNFLAWQLSLELWDDAWPEIKKRQVCQDALRLHRLKTTLAGIKAHVALGGSTVTKATRPPAQGFLRGAMTDAQRAAWHASLAQLRVYPFLDRATAVGRSFASGKATLGFHSRGFVRNSRGRQLEGTRATIVDRGVERAIHHERIGDALRLLIDRDGKRSWHGASFAGQGFATTTAAAAGVVTLRLSDDAGGFAVQASLNPVDVRPTRTYQSRFAPAARSFFGRHTSGCFLKPTHAPRLVYDAVALHDGSRLGARRRTRAYHGRGRFGIADFSAELRIDVPMLRPSRRSGHWHGVGYRKAADLTALTRTLEAIRVSKAQRDTILVDTTTHRRVRFGDEGLRFGSFNFGQIRKVA